ncbi:MAG TPA: hypothetical protein VGZ23_02935 [bacterium]|nr:hypothetical protein [bacterium]
MIRGKTVATGILIAAVTLAAAWLRSPGAPVSSTAGPTVEAQGVIVSVDSNANSFTIAGPQGTQEFFVTPDTVMDLGGTERIAFRDLDKFVGVTTTVLSADTGAQQNANRVTLLVMPARATVPARPARGGP